MRRSSRGNEKKQTVQLYLQTCPEKGYQSNHKDDIEPTLVESTLEPAPVEPVQEGPSQVEPVQVERASIEPSLVESALEPAQVEPVQEEPGQVERASIEPALVESILEPEPAPVEPIQENLAQVEPGQVERASIEPALVESTLEPVPVEPVQEELARVEPGQVESASIEPALVESTLEPVPVDPGPVEPAQLELASIEPSFIQVFGMKETELQEVACHMGHELSVHRKFYHLQDDVIELAKVSKLLLAVESGKAADFKGKSLDDLDVNELPVDDENDFGQEILAEQFQVEPVSVEPALEESVLEETIPAESVMVDIPTSNSGLSAKQSMAMAQPVASCSSVIEDKDSKTTPEMSRKTSAPQQANGQKSAVGKPDSSPQINDRGTSSRNLITTTMTVGKPDSSPQINDQGISSRNSVTTTIACLRGKRDLLAARKDRLTKLRECRKSDFEFEDSDSDSDFKPAAEDDSSDTDVDMPPAKKQKVTAKKKWTKEEKNSLSLLVHRAVIDGKPPKKGDIEKTKNKCPELKNIPWIKIKHQVWAMAQQKNKVAKHMLSK